MSKKVLVLLDKPWKDRNYLIIDDLQHWQKLVSSSQLELENDVSTDALYPARFAMYYKNLGPYALSGHNSDLKKDSLIENEIGVVVAGRSFGIGSSRIHAVRALIDAGVELVIATNFYPVFRKNAVNSGLKISSNFELVSAYLSHEKITFTQLNLTPFEQTILVQGGWLNYLQKLKTTRLNVRNFNIKMVGEKTNCPQTMIEKYLATSAHLKSVQPQDEILLDLRSALIGSYDIYWALIKDTIDKHHPQKKSFICPQHIIATNCHLESNKKTAQHLKSIGQNYALQHNFDYHWQGVCHSIIERKAHLGQMVIFTDSHTPHVGWLGCGLSVGADDMAGAIIYRKLLFKVPQSIKINFVGQVDQEITLRDIAMHILSLQLPSDAVLEYHGAENLPGNPDGWSVLTNIAVESRSVSALIVPTPKLQDYLIKNRQFNARSWKNLAVFPDSEAHYLTEVSVDLSQIKPMIACPPKPQNVMALEDFLQNRPPVKIDKVWIGSCVGGGWRSLDQALRILSTHQIYPGVRVYLQPNSLEVKIKILRKWDNYLDLQKKNLHLLDAVCGACMGEGEGAVGPNEIMISTATRNFSGRNAPGSKVYLASSQTCAWSAIAGKITDTCH